MADYYALIRMMKEDIKKIQRVGVGVIGIGVNSTAVRRYIRHSCVVERPYDLMKFTKAFIEYSTS